MRNNRFSGKNSPVTTSSLFEALEPRLLLSGVNHAPTMDGDVSQAVDLGTMDKFDFANQGTSVWSILQECGAQDADGNPLGIAITAVDNQHGKWQYYMGAGKWEDITIPGTSALLLSFDGSTDDDDANRIRFIPDSGFNYASGFYGEVDEGLTFRIWDQTQGVTGEFMDATSFGGTSSLSQEFKYTKVTVLDQEAPSATPIAPVPRERQVMMNPICLGVNVDSPGLIHIDFKTIAVVGADTSHGRWEYQLNPLDGSKPGEWQPLGTPSVEQARLLFACNLRFIPDEGFSGLVEDALQFFVWSAPNFEWGNCPEGLQRFQQEYGSVTDVSQRGGNTEFSQEDVRVSIPVLAADSRPVLDNSGQMQMDPVYANEFENAGTSLTDILASAGGNRISNVYPWMRKGVRIASMNSAYGRWEYGELTDSTRWQPLQTYTKILVNDVARLRFIPNPGFYGTIADAIVFQAWDGTGPTYVRDDCHNYSEATESVSITVNPPLKNVDADEQFVRQYDKNRAPVLQAPEGINLDAIDPDDLDNDGTLVKDMLSIYHDYNGLYTSDIKDADPWAVQGIAVTNADTTHGKWQFSLDDGASWWYLTASSPTASRLLAVNDTTRIRFLPNTGFSGYFAGLTIRAWDRNTGINGGTADTTISGGNTAFSDEAIQAGVAVREPGISNDQTTKLKDVRQGINYDDASIDTDVIAIPGSFAILETDNTYGRWEWQPVVGGDGTWEPLNVSEDSAFLFNSWESPAIRFIPAPGFTGTIHEALKYVSWKGTSSFTSHFADASVRGDGTPFGGTVLSASLTVTGYNHAPVIEGTDEMMLHPVSGFDFDNEGTTVADILASAPGTQVSDADGDKVGIIVDEVHNVHGDWQYQKAGTDKWHSEFISGIPVILFPEDSIRFVPEAGFVGTVLNGLIFQAFDGSGWKGGGVPAGAGGYACRSLAHGSIGITVTAGEPSADPVEPEPPNLADNHAPTGSTSGALSLPYIVAGGSNPGTPVSSLVEQLWFHDQDSASSGIAVIAANNQGGQWQYTINGGVTWKPLNDVSSSSARLLAADAYTKVRFLPDPDFTGITSVTIRYWDMNNGINGGTIDATVNGGSSCLSTVTTEIQIWVRAPHQKIDFDPQTDFALNPVVFSGYDEGTSVSKLSGHEWIAVLGTNNDHGRWQYRSVYQTSWTTLNPSMTSVIQLDRSASIRFIPDSTFSGTIQDAIKFVSYDPADFWYAATDATFRGENTAYGNNVVTASILVDRNAINSAPVLEPVVQAIKAAALATATPMLAAVATPAPTNPLLTSYGATVDKLVAQAGLKITDRNTGAKKGIAVTASEAVGGTWQYTVDNGKTWHTLKGYATAARLLPVVNTTRVRFVLTSGFKGARKATLTFRAWDRTKGSYGSTITSMVRGGMTYDSLANRTFTLAVPAGTSTPVKSAMPFSAGASVAVVGAAGVKFATPVAETGLSQISMVSGTALAPAVAAISSQKQDGLASAAATEGDGIASTLQVELLPSTNLDMN